MPLRDHFHPPLSQRRSWDELHGGWPMKLVEYLLPLLPARYLASPQVHLGGAVEIDVGTFEYEANQTSTWNSSDEGGVATAPWQATQPLLDVEMAIPDTDEYSVRIYDLERERRLVAAIEIVSPSNKDRPENRKAYVAKCAALLHEEVSVMIVDLVTSRRGQLFGELLQAIGHATLGDKLSEADLYAAVCRTHPSGPRRRLQAWHETLLLGKTLPTLPLWLSSEFALPLNLEVSYEETCRILRM